MNMINLHIKPIDSEEERLEVYKEAEKDGNRSLIMPSHVVKKGREILGAFCLYSPTVYWWMHTKKVKVRDSYSVFQTLNALLANDGVSKYIIPCDLESPYFSLLSNNLNHISSLKGGDWRQFINE